MMAQSTLEKMCFLSPLTIYKEKVREMNKKQVIRLTESQFHNIIKECVKRMLNEGKVVNNLKPREGWDYVDDETGEFVSIPEDPFYKEYSSNDARNKRAEREKNRLYKSDSRLWLDGVWENDTIEKALYRLKHHPEMLEISPESLYFGAVQWEGDPTQMDNCRRIAANNMWELWDIEGQPRYILRKDWVKKHEMDVFGEPNEDSYIRSSEKLIDYYK